MSNLKTGRPSRKDRAIASVQNTQDSMVRLNVNIPKDFYKKIKQKALDEDTTIKEVVKQALDEYMNI